MAMQKRFPVRFEDVFPRGAFLVSEVEAVTDFNAPVRGDGSRPQQLDKDNGLPLWSVQVLDADEEAGKREKTVSVKIAASHQPVPPTNDGPFPFVPVEFVGLTALAWVDESGSRPRIAWSFKAASLVAPGQGKKAGHTSPSSAPSEKAA
ncbi:plasmid replication, integration and excision activator [Arsenicicoccus bolidensis]|uniref:Plasmid replication, integration and excision activator n=1 Tax=Arsenicicoccus bolidensis TaxID=229480 RepID=A0ABS9PYX8_9MICO|nr:plasmid replication, integration and excision activator [Arsenicicoccus bolidensis]MCG7320812.1 plasmid replication, integration and excision activator [Arsenicicoccus bolidensis]